VAEVIVALDQPTAREALALVDRLPGLRWAKVGATVFVREGPGIVGALRDRGVEVFLDLKWHDIPSQVAGASAAAAALDIRLATVHALGGLDMMRAAKEAAGTLRVVAVTVLTSHGPDELGRIFGREAGPAREAIRLAGVVRDAGLDGVVTSPLEAAAARAALGPDAWIVVPGIRAAGAAAHDQRRTAGARDAVAAGATHLVVGRPISGASDPRAVYERLCEEAA